jgi:hypothetical protein
LEAAQDRWEELADAHKLEADFLRAVAADVATEDGVDKTIIATLHGLVLSRLLNFPNVDTMETTGHVKSIIDMARVGRTKPLAVIDAIGVGTGVVDRLREQGIKVDAFMGSSKAKYHDKTGELTFLNRRAESWWNLRDLLNPAFDTPSIAIPTAEFSPTLTGDLIAPKWDQTSTGAIKIEDKDDIRKRLGRSPDEGDAVTMAYNARLDRGTDILDAAPKSLEKTSTWGLRP